MKLLQRVVLCVALTMGLMFSTITFANDPPGGKCTGYSQTSCKNSLGSFSDEVDAFWAGAASVKFDSDPSTCWDLTYIIVLTPSP